LPTFVGFFPFSVLTAGRIDTGVFGSPEVNIPWIDDLIARAPYDGEAQNHISFAGYWCGMRVV
jgi:hypothetical protein